MHRQHRPLDVSGAINRALFARALVATAFPGVAISTVAPNVATEWRDARLVLFLVAFALFVATLGVGVLRHHLYDIDLVINRTLVYGALAVGITAVYAGVVAKRRAASARHDASVIVL